MVVRLGPQKARKNYLREWRERAGLTQAALAVKIGERTDKSQISRWEKHERPIAPGAQIALARALGVKPDDIFRDPGAESIDALLANAPADVRQRVIGYAEALLRGKRG